jgi:hypothetical protein
VRDFAHAAAPTRSTRSRRPGADRLEIDALGLDAMDRRYLTDDRRPLRRRPGRDRDARAGLSEPRDTLEDVIEPYLIQLGLIARTARGRCLNGRGWQHSGSIRPRAPVGPVRSRGEIMDVACRLLALQASRQPRSRLFQTGDLALPSGPDRYLHDPLRTTALDPNGYGSTGLSPVAKDAGVDCFIVYPTVSRDSGMNSDLIPATARKRARSSASSPVSQALAGSSRRCTGR